MEFVIYFWFIFSIVFTRGYGFGVGGQDRPRLVDDDIHDLIASEVAVVNQVFILEVCGSMKATMIELFDEWYVVVS